MVDMVMVGMDMDTDMGMGKRASIILRAEMVKSQYGKEYLAFQERNNNL